MKAYDYDRQRMGQPPRHKALVNTSVDDCRISLKHCTEADLEDIRKAVKVELAKGPDARATMVRVLKSAIQRLEKQAWKRQQEVADERA